MIIEYSQSKAENGHNFVLKGEITESEVEAFITYLSQLLHPREGLKVQVSLDCSELVGGDSCE